MTNRMIKNGMQFALASTSIICLLAEMYQLTTLRFAVCAWLIPAALILLVWTVWAYVKKDRETVFVVLGGALFGFVAAIAYDIYRIPFAMQGFPIFSVFPKFGEMILGLNAPRWAVHTTGWIYHFSNGMAFAIMYLALLRNREWWWGIVWALGIEIFLLLSPYPQVFGFKISPTFIAITLTAHLIFGLAMGYQLRIWKQLQLFPFVGFTERSL